MILPALASAAFLVVLACWQNARCDRLERERGRARETLATLPGDSDERPKLEARLERLAEREHRLLPRPESRRRRRGHRRERRDGPGVRPDPPVQPGRVRLAIVLLAIVVYWQRLWTSSREGGETRPKPSLVRIAAVAAIASVLVSIARQVDPMTQLPSVAVYLSADEKSAADQHRHSRRRARRRRDRRPRHGHRRDRGRGRPPHAFDQHVSARSRHRAERPATARAAHAAASLMSQLLFHDAWAWTPLRVWCEGDGYGWTRLGSVCKARPRASADSLRVVGTPSGASGSSARPRRRRHAAAS
jgi:hypothetical protein